MDKQLKERRSASTSSNTEGGNQFLTTAGEEYGEDAEKARELGGHQTNGRRDDLPDKRFPQRALCNEDY